MEVKIMKTFVKVTGVVWTLAFVGGFITGKSAFANDVQDHYKNVIQKKPYSVEVCYEQQTSGDKTGDAIKGAIIGGLLGNNIKGEQDGGAIGAVIGGMLGHSNSDASPNVITQCRNHVNYTTESRRVYSHSIITFMHNGRYYKLRFQK